MGWVKEYKESLKLIEVEEVFDLVFYRPFAFLIVKAVYRTNITPNQLTFTSIILGVCGGYFFSIGKPAFITAGALLYIASNIFDCSDGQLSRLKHNGTVAGRIIDGIADFTVMIAIYIGIAIGFSSHQENSQFWLIMLIITGFSNLVHSILIDYYRNRFLDYYKQRKFDFEENLQVYKDAYFLAMQQKGKWFDRIIIFVYLKYCDLQRILVAKRKLTPHLKIDPQEYYRRNRVIMRLWLFLGPTTQITNLVVCSLFQRLDLFMWIVLIGFNGLALLLWIIQQVIDRTYKPVYQ